MDDVPPVRREPKLLRRRRPAPPTLVHGRSKTCRAGTNHRDVKNFIMVDRLYEAETAGHLFRGWVFHIMAGSANNGRPANGRSDGGATSSEVALFVRVVTNWESFGSKAEHS